MKNDAETVELIYYVDNTPAYSKQKQLIFRALAKKKDKDKYDHNKAPKAFHALLVTAAKSYIREHGSMGDKWNQTFSVVCRKHAADELAESFLNWYRVDYRN